MSNNTSSGGGVTFAGLLTILFIGLKLGHVITWSWLWVLSPLWIGFVIGWTFFVLVLLGVAIADKRKRRRNKKKHELRMAEQAKRRMSPG